MFVKQFGIFLCFEHEIMLGRFPFLRRPEPTPSLVRGRTLARRERQFHTDLQPLVNTFEK